MKNSRKLLWTPLCVSLLSLALAGSAQSESGPDYAKTGGYVGLGFALGIDNWPSFVPDSDPAYGFDAWGGYRFHPNFSAELQLEYLNGFDTPGGPVGVSGQGVTFTGNMKYYILKNRFQPFLLAGVGLGWQELTNGLTTVGESGLAGRLGGGIDFYLTESIALQVSSSYVFVRYGLDPLREQGDYVSVLFGAQYRF